MINVEFSIQVKEFDFFQLILWLPISLQIDFWELLPDTNGKADRDRLGKISRKVLYTSVILFTSIKDIQQAYIWPRNGLKVSITHKAIRSR